MKKEEKIKEATRRILSKFAPKQVEEIIAYANFIKEQERQEIIKIAEGMKDTSEDEKIYEIESIKDLRLGERGGAKRGRNKALNDLINQIKK